jgi:Tol biopolymer transport system component
VHRDLKPGNVFVTKSGRVKVLDFGLAKLTRPEVLAASGESAVSVAATETGVVLGTVGYMSPEQVRGEPADPRSDIFALGAILYELLTGKRTFHGATYVETLNAILKEDPPPLTTLRADLPPAIDRIVRRCLEKDPVRRFQTAQDLAFQLETVSDIAYAPDAPSRTEGLAPPRGKSYGILFGVSTLLLAGAGVVLGLVLARPDRAPVLRASLDLPAGVELDKFNTSIAISPNARMVAFAANALGKKQQIWLRPLDGMVAQALPGTEGATYPFWSPDSRFIGFFADQKLKRVSVAGGTVETLSDAIEGRGATWSSKGMIVFAPAPMGGLYAVPASGGKANPVTTVAGVGVSDRLPHFLPDGKRVLYWSAGSIWSLDLQSRKVALVASENSEGIYVEPGYLVFVRDGNLMAQRIDSRSLRLKGEAVPIADGVSFAEPRRTGAYALSRDRLLLYMIGGPMPEAQLTWFDLAGQKLGTLGEPARFGGLEISPDGAHALATQHRDGRDVWIYDFTRDIGTRFTFDDDATYAAWSPDGRQIVYYSGQEMLVKPSDGPSEAKVLLTGQFAGPTSWSTDGDAIAFDSQTHRSGTDVSILPLGGSGKAYTLIGTPAQEESAAFSPDGKWVLYSSDESGRPEVYVARFPGGGGKLRVTTHGGTEGVWIRDGQRIIYQTPEEQLVAIAVTARGASLDFGAPRLLLAGRKVSGEWAVAPTGDRILVAVPTQEGAPKLIVVTNWRANLKGD